MVVDFMSPTAPATGARSAKAWRCAKRSWGLRPYPSSRTRGYESAKDIRKCLMSGRCGGRGIYPGPGGTGVSAGLRGAGDNGGNEGLCQTRGHPGLASTRACCPDRYENTNIRIQLQSLGPVSCFIRHEDGRVTCPMGRELFKQKATRYGIEYSSKEACRTAPTAAPTPERKSMSILATTAAMSPCACMEDPRYPLQQIPDAEQRSPYNNFGKLKRAEKRVMVFLRRDMPKQKLRQRTSEHPFGTIKHYDGAGHFLCKGKGEGHSGVRPVRAVLQSPQGDQPVRRRTKSHRALPQHRYAQNAENRRTLRGKPLFFC